MTSAPSPATLLSAENFPGLPRNPKWFLDDNGDYFDFARYLLDPAPLPGDYVRMRLTINRCYPDEAPAYVTYELGEFDGSSDDAIKTYTIELTLNEAAALLAL